MRTYRLKDSILLIYPNGKFTICSEDNLDFLSKQNPGTHPNFNLAVCGGQGLALGTSLVCTGVEATTRGYTLTYRSAQHSLDVTTELAFVPESNVVIQTNRVKNFGTQTAKLTSFSSAFLGELACAEGMPWNQNEALTVHICRSKWQGEGQWRQYTPQQLNLNPVSLHSFEASDYTISSIGSWSTAHFYPIMMVEDKTHGKTWFLEIEGSHNWLLRLHSTGGYEAASLGIEASGCEEANGGWQYDLKPGEEYTAERAFFGVSDGGFEAAVADLTAFKRADSTVRFENDVLPVVFNDYMNSLWAQQTPELILPLVDRACAAGAEVFCIDGGWCEKGNGRTGIGDWLPKHEYYDMDGLRKIADYIRSKNMLPGIWLELESCDKDALGVSLDEDAVLKRHDVRIGEVFTYNFSKEAVRNYLTARVRALYEIGFRYIKNDYNHTIGVGATNNYDGDSAAEGGIKNAEQFYAFVDSLYKQFPDLIIENCGSGALRCDHKMLRRCYLQSTSDQEVCYNNPSIVMGSMAILPPEKAGIWAYPYPSVFPYDAAGNYIPFVVDDAYAEKMADGRETVFNMVTAMTGFLYLSGRIDACDEKNFALIKEGVQLYKEIRTCIPHSRPVYPLGLAALGDQRPAALGLLSENRLLLAVWNLSEAEAAVSVPLAAYADAGLRLNKTYPKHTACTLAENTLHVTLAAKAAAYFVFDI